MLVALKGVTRCGCFEDPCSMSREHVNLHTMMMVLLQFMLT